MVGKIWTSGNEVLIPDFPKPYTISAGNLNIPKSYREHVKLIGPIISTLPDGLPTKKQLRKKLGLPTNKPVLFAPISGPLRERAFLTAILSRILQKFPDDYEIVMSLGYPNADHKPVRHSNLTIYKWLPNRFEYLKACDLVISRAGHGTLTQCLCYGKPTIIVPTPSHTEQLNNAKQVEAFAAAKMIEQQGLSREKLLNYVQQILNDGTPERLTQIQQEVLRHNGLENAVKTVTEIAEKND
jgi:UDP:flavonoid glycosyltransferase YjiC (YdhE family)